MRSGRTAPPVCGGAPLRVQPGDGRRLRGAAAGRRRGGDGDRPQAPAGAGVPGAASRLHGAWGERLDGPVRPRFPVRCARGVLDAAAHAAGAGVPDGAGARQAVSVSVVIPTWNGRALLDVALASLERQSQRADEVIVVDNGSSDGTAGHVRAEWPAVTLVALEENTGFAAATNRGVEASAGDVVVLVNNDV